MSDTPLRILVVDDEVNIRKTLSLCLEGEGHEAVAVGNSRDALDESSRRSFDLAFVDLRLGTTNGLELIQGLLAASPWLRVIVITAYASIETAVEAMRRGATDYLPKPFTPAQVKMALRKVVEVRALEQRVAALEEDLGSARPEADFTSDEPAMQRALSLARQVAPSDATLLLRGESGTGKSLLARAVHAWSQRAAKPFGVVSCPALSPELLESELFGHVQGAFTGAVRDHPGRVASCEGGTLFLDEIGDLPLSVQPKLLRFLQDREYERLGESTTRRAEVRILAATGADVERAVREGRFREDLFYRLNVIQILIPPLRERPGDIAPLARRLLAFFGKNRRPSLVFLEATLEALQSYSWPGNVRELRNVVERAAILCQTAEVGPDLLPEGLALAERAPGIGDPVSLEKIEELHIRRVLAAARSLQDAADILGMDQATLWRRRKKYGL